MAIGYAVIDLETTGLWTARHDRVIEVGVVHLDPAGETTGEWSTLVNPERDLGAQHIHGIGVADIRHAPTFGQIAGALVDRLRGRVPVAHNLEFDLGFLRSEFTRLGAMIPDSGICTMLEAERFLPGTPRTLAECCAVAGIPLDGHHDALVDARAAAGLLRHYLGLARPVRPWRTVHAKAAKATWPLIEDSGAVWVRRGVSAERVSHFLDRVPQTTTRPGDGADYLALLDHVLLDEHISVTEADALVDMADKLGLSRTDLDRLHRGYLAAVAADGRDVEPFAELLRLPVTAVEEALAASGSAVPLPRFQLQPGDLVVFTGEVDGGQDVWEKRAREASYVPHPNVTKKVRLVVAADPDSLSGKAKKARAYGIPIVTPEGFARMLG
ncbi:exonuclease domain-containing protein [Rhizohabitans arisaemae]|uniref:exonuclease domain-containing protein n=1 Tax=Rhizohabitans arisaemae TaxID=2720610 RepID=UPI0024B0CEC5|nr:exonuclease domain-containing protein [Rhizohabitans arisaemae]